MDSRAQPAARDSDAATNWLEVEDGVEIGRSLAPSQLLADAALPIAGWVGAGVPVLVLAQTGAMFAAACALFAAVYMGVCSQARRQVGSLVATAQGLMLYRWQRRRLVEWSRVRSVAAWRRRRSAAQPCSVSLVRDD